MNLSVGEDDNGQFMIEYAEKEGPLTQHRRMLISTYFLDNGTVITSLLLFYLELGLVCKKIYRFVQYSPMQCSYTFVQSEVNARKDGDENPKSSVVAQTMILLAISSYGYQIMDRSPHTVKKFLRNEKLHGIVNARMLKRLG